MSISACSNQTVGKESSIQSSAVEATSQSKISLDAGDLIGYRTNAVHTFKGIPYAKTERFANPEPIQEFENSPQMALTYGSVAPTHKVEVCVGNRRVVYTFSTADSFCFCLNDS